MGSTMLSAEDRAKFIPIIDNIFHGSDLATVSVKKVRNGLQQELGVDLSASKKEVDSLITERFDKILAEKDNGVSVDDASADDVAVSSTGGSASPAQRKKRKSSSLDADAKMAAELHAQLNGGRGTRSSGTRKKSTKPVARGKKSKKSSTTVDSEDDDAEGGKPEKKKRKVNPNNAFNKPLMLSAPLAELVGETQLSRPECVKRIWAHIKSHDLQDPSDKRQIICDDRMQTVFGPKVHMFTMNKLLSQHMYKQDEISHPAGSTGAEVASTLASSPNPDASEED